MDGRRARRRRHGVAPDAHDSGARRHGAELVAHARRSAARRVLLLGTRGRARRHDRDRRHRQQPGREVHPVRHADLARRRTGLGRERVPPSPRRLGVVERHDLRRRRRQRADRPPGLRRKLAGRREHPGPVLPGRLVQERQVLPGGHPAQGARLRRGRQRDPGHHGERRLQQPVRHPRRHRRQHRPRLRRELPRELDQRVRARRHVPLQVRNDRDGATGSSARRTASRPPSTRCSAWSCCTSPTP